MNQTFLSFRFEQIEKRFAEIEVLLTLAQNNQQNSDYYQALCRSAHVLLVSHFEGLYKEMCRDIIDDINKNTKFFEVKKTIFNTHCDYFIHTSESEKSTNTIRGKLFEAFKEYPSKLRIEPFLFVDNKNPAPKILETILERFGVKNFFWSLEGSDLDIVFEDLRSKTEKIRKRLLRHLLINTSKYPYTVSTSIYNPVAKVNQLKTKTLWEDFLNGFLKERHNIVHGHITDNPNNHDALHNARVKIEILLYAYILNICSATSPIIFLPESTT